MGRNEVSVFVCNESRWGHMGRNRVSPLEMGIEGRGRVSGIPIPVRRLKSLDTENKAASVNEKGKKSNFE
jgi:hypothetical protein